MHASERSRSIAPRSAAGTYAYPGDARQALRDFSEAASLADKNPKTLEEMQLLFYTEAAKYNVLPLDNNRIPRVDVSIRPRLTRGRNEFTY